jgi:hypothetical protein
VTRKAATLLHCSVQMLPPSPSLPTLPLFGRGNSCVPSFQLLSSLSTRCTLLCDLRRGSGQGSTWRLSPTQSWPRVLRLPWASGSPGWLLKIEISSMHVPLWILGLGLGIVGSTHLCGSHPETTFLECCSRHHARNGAWLQKWSLRDAGAPACNPCCSGGKDRED